MAKLSGYLTGQLANPAYGGMLSQSVAGGMQGIADSLAQKRMSSSNMADPEVWLKEASKRMAVGDMQGAAAAMQQASVLRQKQNALLDEGQAEIAATTAQSRAKADAYAQKGAAITGAAATGRALEQFLDPDLSKAIAIGALSPGDAIKEQRQRNEEAGRNSRQASSNQAQIDAALIRQMQATGGPAPDKFQKVVNTPEFKTYDLQYTQANRALQLLNDSANIEQSGPLAQRVVSEIYNGDSKAASEIDRFVASRSLGTTFGDWVNKLAGGRMSKETVKNLREIAALAKKSAERERNKAVNSALDVFGVTDPESRSMWHNRYGTSEVAENDPLGIR